MDKNKGCHGRATYLLEQEDLQQYLVFERKQSLRSIAEA